MKIISTNNENKVICWFSGGVTSAVACKLAIDIYGKENCRVIMMGTQNEDSDTYRFLKDCEKWYDIEIEMITMLGRVYNSKGLIFNKIQDTWRHYKSLNTANGAICSSILKRDLRIVWEKENEGRYLCQVFGFEFKASEFKRAMSLKMNYPKTNPIFPLLMTGHSKPDCINILIDAGIEIPATYGFGFHNNNCFETGCTQGGIGYWQKMARDFPEKFDIMADEEHLLTDMKGKPVTMCKDQSKAAKDLVEETGDNTLALVFLKPHPDYPHIKDISIMKGREPEPLIDCNGFCGVNDLSKRNPTELEINFDN
jgi:hypothetical protein